MPRFRYSLRTLFIVITLIACVMAAGPRGRVLLLNTAWLCLGTAAISVPLGTLLAVALVKTDIAGRRFAAALLAGWLFVPLYIQAGAGRAGFGTLGWVRDSAVWFEGWPGTIWIHGLAAVPWVALVVGAALRNVERSIEELALLEARPSEVFWRVTLPRILPAIGLAALFVCVVAAGEMTVTALFMISTYADELYTAMSGTGDVSLATLEVLPGVVLTALLIGAGAIGAKRMFCGRALLSLQPPLRFRLGPDRGRLSALLFGCLTIALGLPLFNLLVQSDPGWRGGWSLFASMRVLAASPDRFSREIGWSVLISGLAATAAVALAALLAWPARRGAGWLPWLVIGPLWAIPAPLIALALLSSLGASHQGALVWLCDRTVFLPVVGQMLRAMPVAAVIVWYALRTIPRELWETMELERMSRWRQWTAVIWPLRRRAVLAAWIAALAIAFADLGATLLLSPPGVTTLSARVFDRLHSGADDQVAGISLLVVFVTTLLAWWTRTAWRRFIDSD